VQLPDPTLSSTAVSVLFALASVAACGGPEPRMLAAKNDDGVPANSASEERLKRGGPTKPATPQASDPTEPLTTPMTGDNNTATATGAGGAGAGGAPGKSAPGKGNKAPLGKSGKEPSAGTTSSAQTVATGKVTKAECKQLFDKYIDVAMANDSRFEGIPPEMITSLKEQALAQAQSQKGDPCSGKEVSRAQYTCAMSSTSTGAWERCMK
jgi:hypothetical protein